MEFAKLGYRTLIQTPTEKDFNLDLRVFKGMIAPTTRLTAKQSDEQGEDLDDGLEL